MVVVSFSTFLSGASALPLILQTRSFASKQKKEAEKKSKNRYRCGAAAVRKTGASREHPSKVASRLSLAD